MAEGKPDLALVLRHYGVDVPEHRVTSLVCCPVHEENRPSCSVSLLKQVFSCKACGAAGDSYSLIQAKEGVDFRGAIEFARQHLGLVEQRREETGRRGLGGSPRRPRGYRPAFKRKGLAD